MADWRILLTGGSTAGHVTAALAVTEALRAYAAESGTLVTFLYVGSKAGAERALAEHAGIDFRGIQTGKLRAYASVQNLLDAFRIPFGIAQALWVLGRFRPGVVLSTGGFAAVPAAVAAWMLRVPVVTHDQTATIGLANQIISALARISAVTHAAALSELRPRARSRALVTGNPIRSGLRQGDPARALKKFDLRGQDLPVVYVTGGSLGARSINRAVEQELPAILGACHVIHQCGDRSDGDVKEVDRLRARATALPVALQCRYHVVPFLDEETLADVYALADLVVGRSGAGTTAELAELGKASILIPLSPTRHDEQRKNALRLQSSGGAVIIEQQELTGDQLLQVLLDLLGSPPKLAQMAANAAQLARPDAAAQLARAVAGLLETKN